MSNRDTYNVLRSLERAGISYEDATALRRISLALRRWNERECNGEVERDEDTGKVYAVYNIDGPGPINRFPTADKERGAQKRLAAIMARYPKLGAYEQGDPRGCALYIYLHEDLDRFAARVQERTVSISSCYSSIGIGVY
jgi:hypothetical protein